MNRRQLLAGGLGTLTAALGLRGGRSRAAEGRCLIVHWNDGGWDPSYVFEPRTESDIVDSDPDSTLAEVQGIRFADAATRPDVRSFFEQHGAMTAVINGLAVGSISHTACTRHVLTGSRLRDAADLPTRVASGTGGNLAMPHLVLSGPRFPGTLGEVMVPLSQTLVDTVEGSLPAGADHDAAAEARARAYLHATAEDLASAGGGAAENHARFARGLQRREALEGAVESLTLPQGASSLERLSAGTAALSLGLTNCLIVEGSLPERLSWDSHQNNHLAQDSCFQKLFSDLNTLVQLLQATEHTSGDSLLDRTTVVVLSEMGRTPVLNSGQGKDHWPYTSALVFGAGVAGGQVIGASDDVLVSAPTDPTTGEASSSGEILTPAHLIAGLLESFDLDPAAAFPDTPPLSAPFTAR